MNALAQDLRFAARTLTRDPIFAAVAMLTLALGIGATSTIFGIVNTLILDPFPAIEAPARVVWLFEHTGEQDDDRDSISAANYVDWRAQSKTISRFAAMNIAGFTMTGAGAPEHVGAFTVSAGFFELLGARPALGRTFAEGEDTAGRERVAILSDGFWKRRFGADREVVGRTIVLDNHRYTVVGVMGPGFGFPRGSDLWVPQVITPEMLADRNVRPFAAIGRLAAGASVEEATAELKTISARLEQQYPATNKGWGVVPISVIELFIGPAVAPTTALLLASLFVLLIACANVSNLLLARAARREREMAVRTALGATPGRLTRQMLTESLVLALGGGLLGVLVAMWGVDLFTSLLPDRMKVQMPRLAQISVDLPTLGYTFAAACVAALVFGWLPARRAARTDVNQMLKEGGGGATRGARHSRLREVLVVAQVCLALMLVVGAGWAVQSFLERQNVRLGFDPEHVLTLGLSLDDPDPAVTRRRWEELVREVRTIPGVEGVGLTSSLPLERGFASSAFTIEGRPAPSLDAQVSASFMGVSPGYLEAIGVARLSGRSFDERDNEDGPRVALVSAKFARVYLDGADPVGQRLVIDGERTEIVGVVDDVHSLSRISALIYLPWRQAPAQPPAALVLRTKGAPEESAQLLRARVHAFDRELPVAEPQAMTALVADAFAGRRVMKDVFVALSLLALLLAAVGIYGVISYSVSQRTAEIGIRSALGAAPSQVMAMVMRQGLRLAGVGMAVGLVLSVLITIAVARAMDASTSASPLVFAAGCLVLLAVSAAACWGPARRAMRIPPMLALKRE